MIRTTIDLCTGSVLTCVVTVWWQKDQSNQLLINYFDFILIWFDLITSLVISQVIKSLQCGWLRYEMIKEGRVCYMWTLSALSIPAFLPTEIRRLLWSGLVCSLRDVRQNWEIPRRVVLSRALKRGMDTFRIYTWDVLYPLFLAFGSSYITRCQPSANLKGIFTPNFSLIGNPSLTEIPWGPSTYQSLSNKTDS